MIAALMSTRCKASLQRRLRCDTVTFLLHVHLLDFLLVQDLDGDFVGGSDVLSYLHLEVP